MNASNAWQQLTQMITASWTSRAISVAAKLRVADRLADGPRAAEGERIKIAKMDKMV